MKMANGKKFQPVNTVLTRDLVDKLDRLAEKRDVNRSVVIRDAVREYVTSAQITSQLQTT